MNADFVLLADDNSTDAELTTRALEIGGVSKNIIWVQDGEAALHFVFRTGPYADRAPRNPRLMPLCNSGRKWTTGGESNRSTFIVSMPP